MIYNLPRAKKKGETWVMKDYFVNCELAKTDIMFTSNGKSFSSLTSDYNFTGLIGVLYDSTKVANLDLDPLNGGCQVTWKDGYQTVTFLEPPTGDLLTWLQSNAVKQ